MKKIIAFTLIVLISLTGMAQEKKSSSKTTEQHRSAKTGRYVTKSETKKSPSTTYTTKRKR
jgi:hypothetical protein